MSNPKPFLNPGDAYARIKELERVVKALHTTPRTGYSSTAAAEVPNVDALLTTSALWRNLPHAGPTVTFTTSPSGKVAVIGTASCSLFPDGTGNVNGYISVSVDGATPVAGREAGYQIIGDGSMVIDELDCPVMFSHVLTLTPNASHTLTMKYLFETGTEVSWWNRVLIVMPI